MTAISDGGTLMLPRHKAARLAIAPDTGSLSDQKFRGSGGEIFTLEAGANAAETVIVPTGVLGTEDLKIKADGDANAGTIPLEATIHVQVVPGLAVTLEFTYEMPGALARKFPQTGGQADLPMNKTGTRVTVRALDASGDVVALVGQAWEAESANFEVVATADPNVVTLIPVTPGAPSDLMFDADADISGDTVAIDGAIEISVLNAVPTTFTMSYSLEAP